MPYEQPENDAVDFTLESYSQPDNDAVDFSLDEQAETADPEEPEPTPPFRLPSDPLELPGALDLPLRPINFRSMNAGLSIFLVGSIGLLGGAAWILKNYIAMALLGLGVVAMLMSGTLGISLGMFWALLIATVLVLITGALWRMMAE